MKTYYKDFYGGTASISETARGAHLIIRISNGKKIYDKMLKTVVGAKRILSQYSDGTAEEVKKG